jgi:hypothetical protein
MANIPILAFDCLGHTAAERAPLSSHPRITNKKAYDDGNTCKERIHRRASMTNHNQSLSPTKKDSRRRSQTPAKSRKGTMSTDVSSISKVDPPPCSPSKKENKHNLHKATKSPKRPNKRIQGGKTSTTDKNLGPSTASRAQSLAEIRGSRTTQTNSPTRRRANSLTRQSPGPKAKKLSTPRTETNFTQKRVHLPTSPKAQKHKSTNGSSKKKRPSTPLRVSPRKADRARDPTARDSYKRGAPSPKPASPERTQSHQKRNKTPLRRRGTLPFQLPLAGTPRPLVGILKPSTYPRGPVVSSIEDEMEHIRDKRWSSLKLALSERVRVSQKKRGKSGDNAPIAAAMDQVEREEKDETVAWSTPLKAFRQRASPQSVLHDEDEDEKEDDDPLSLLNYVVQRAYPQGELLDEDEEEDDDPLSWLSYVVHRQTPEVFRDEENNDDRQQEQDYLSADRDSRCDACGFQACYVPEGMVSCLSCKNVSYCSVLCLQWDLTSGDHANECIGIG